MKIRALSVRRNAEGGKNSQLTNLFKCQLPKVHSALYPPHANIKLFDLIFVCKDIVSKAHSILTKIFLFNSNCPSMPQVCLRTLKHQQQLKDQGGQQKTGEEF